MRFLNLLFVATVATLFIGCAGPRFSPMTNAPGDKAVVYIYRKSSISGIAGNHHVFVNGKAITSLYSGSYYPYLAEPGTNTFSSKAYSPDAILNTTMNFNFRDRVCQFNAEAGKIYYIQFDIATSWGPRMTLVDADKGAEDIQNCRLAKTLTP